MISTIPLDEAAVVKAAQWLADQREPPERAVPALKERFKLTSPQACEAIRLAGSYRTARRAFG